jgi:Set1/Ash2 histone methyltransferase complex subunit ASH2
VRASHGAHEGCFYFEATITNLGPSGGARIGWSTRRAELQAPVGYDAHGFGVRAATGEKVSGAVRRPYGVPFSAPGSVLGCFLYLPPGGRRLERGRGDVVVWKGEPYLVDRPEAPAKPLLGSIIAFSVDGAFQGVAWSDVPEGTYYPTVSLFTLPGQAPPAKVRLNFGPNFAFPPGKDGGWAGVRAGEGGGGEGVPRPRPAAEMAGPKPGSGGGGGGGGGGGNGGG